MSELKQFSGAPGIVDDFIQKHSSFTCGLTALQSENLVEAYLCFSALPDCTAAQFNLAVCYKKAGLYEKALDALACAERQLSAAHPLPQTGHIPAELCEHDAKGTGYCAPIEQEAPERFPVQTKLRVLRLKADLYGALGYERELRALLFALSGKGYKNIEEWNETLRK